MFRMRVLSILWLLLISACAHTVEDIPPGIARQKLALVPARIAVFPCQSWPQTAHFDDLVAANVSEEQLGLICQQFDKYILQGFEDQPYMRGLAPNAVKTLIQRAKQPELAKLPMNLWVPAKAPNCKPCTHPGSYYYNVVSKQPEWLVWLGDLSRAAKNADAVLLPFVVTAQEEMKNERGIPLAERSIYGAMLLIDTNSGQLLWSSHRLGLAQNRNLPQNGRPSPPPWDMVFDRLFVNDLWREFPGRQEY